MIVMAFSIPKESLIIIEHNRKYYRDRISTPLFEHSQELLAQLNFLFHEKQDRQRGFRWRSEYYSAFEVEEELAYGHVSLMFDQVHDDWNREYTKEWNAGQARMRKEMAG